MFAEPRNVVQLAFDRMRVVRRQHGGVDEEVFAAHDADARMIGQPRRRGRIRDDEDVADPGCEQVNRPEREFQFVDLPVAGLIVIALPHHVALHPTCSGALPFDRRPVDPGEDDVDVESDLARQVAEHAIEGAPRAPVTLDTALDEFVGGHGGAGECVFPRQGDAAIRPLPELQAHTRRRAVAQAPFGFDAGSKEREGARLRVSREPALGDEYGRRGESDCSPMFRTGVERFELER